MTPYPLPKSVSWQQGTLILLDQRKLPLAEAYLSCSKPEEVFAAIQCLAVRGAPAIGIAAAYAMALHDQNTISCKALEQRSIYLASARPTAVNLSWAVERMLDFANQNADKGSVQQELLLSEARRIHQEDAVACRTIGELGAELIRGKTTFLTHCNAGALAVSEYGTALAPIYTAFDQGETLHVFVDETRPLLQGARLTSFELERYGVPCTLITDNMAAHLLSKGEVEAVIVGADRVAANGDVANKIGTLGLAVLANHFNIPFYVACPTSTIDRNMIAGSHIVIEERKADEVTHLHGIQTAPSGMNVYNPAFDVTPAALVSAVITELGIVAHPDEAGIARLLEADAA